MKEPMSPEERRLELSREVQEDDARRRKEARQQDIIDWSKSIALSTLFIGIAVALFLCLRRCHN